MNPTTPRHRQALAVLKDLRIFTDLQTHHPLLAGTVPIGIDLPDSDLDILCEAHDLPAFQSRIRALYGSHTGFRSALKLKKRLPCVTASFTCQQFEIQIFGQPVPTDRQDAWRHMIVEERILSLLGEPFRQEILRLKAGGHKTEPAFALALNLPGDPYQALLDMAAWDDSRLRRFLLEGSPND